MVPFPSEVCIKDVVQIVRDPIFDLLLRVDEFMLLGEAKEGKRIVRVANLHEMLVALVLQYRKLVLKCSKIKGIKSTTP